MQKAIGLRSLAFTVLIALSQLFVTTAAWAATTGTLQGTVRSTAGRPLARANVSLGNGQGATTDAQGRYVIIGLTPDTYSVRVSFAGYLPLTQQATITQDQTAILDFSLQPRTGGGRTLITVAPVRRTQTATATVITAEAEQKVKSQPNNLYQFPGLLFGQPGISYDPSGYVHIRGADLFQTGFQVDGISILNPATNEFGTNIVTVGLKSANFYTNGADASYGNASGGFINEITQNGRDLRGGIIEGTVGPQSQWQYLGTNTQVGNVTPNGKFDYYASTIRFRNNFPQPIFTVTSVNDSNDNVVKFNYYADPNNTVTAFYGSGLEDYNYSPVGITTTAQIEQPSYNAQPNGTSTNGHEVQSYQMGYLSYQHRFSPTSFANLRYYQHHSVVDFHEEALAYTFRHETFTNQGVQFDYQNQFTPVYRLQAGVQYLPSVTSYHLLTNLNGTNAAGDADVVPWQDPSIPSRGYTDRSSVVNPKQTVLYLQNQLRPFGDKLVFDAGVRFASDDFTNLKRISDYTDHYTDPRFGLTYSPNRNTVFRTSYTYFSQFPETRYMEYDAPEDTGVFPDTARVPSDQVTRIHTRYTPNQLRPYFSKNFDLGVEQAFTPFGNRGFLGGTYAVSLTGFDKRQQDLLQLNRADLTFYQGTGNPFPIQYTNDSKGHTSGFEFVLSKRARNPEDINGFVSYTNLVARATSSFFDTGYEPYFGFALAGADPSLSLSQIIAGNKQQFPTSYDQRHTIAAQIGKRFGKVIEPNIVLDAGSGFPFAGGAAIDPAGQFGIGIDARHGEAAGSLLPGTADFTEVPVVYTAGGNRIIPYNPTVGRSGWHYKISVNTNFYITPQTNLFLNVDNVFDRLFTVTFATTDQIGNIYYEQPSAQYPQGKEYFGKNNTTTPIFLSFGFRHRF